MVRAPLRRAILSVALLAGVIAPAAAQLSLRYNTPGASIGVQLGGYPTLQRIPGYPVYYAPNVGTNYFFYDGLYWVFQNDAWYASTWYNGPWGAVDPMDVPDFILRVPVRYYRYAPTYFHGWRSDAPPRWNEHWGRGWEDRHRGWDRWDRRSAPAPAPLPAYQRQYRGERYPAESARQAELHDRNYRYQPREAVARQHYEASRSEVRQDRRNERQAQPEQRRQQRQDQRQAQPEQRRDQRQAQPEQHQEQRQDQRKAQPEQRRESQGNRNEGDKRPNWYSGG